MLTDTRPDASAGPESITAAELEEYRDRAERLKCLERDLHGRRESLVARVKAGVRCEIGPWIPQLVRMESRRFSARAVAEALGTDVMEEVRAGITPTVSEIFGIIPREGWGDDEQTDDAA